LAASTRCGLAEEGDHGGKRKSTNPSRPSQVVGVFQDASKEHAIEAIEAANKYFDVWKKVPAQETRQVLFKAAAIVRERKYELGRWFAMRWEILV